MANKRLITSALPYVNNEPHLGNIIGCVLSADTFARYCRLNGFETLYVCGNDEYGTATETKAHEEGVTPKEICDKYHKIHTDIYAHFNISFDAFGRTATPEHTVTVQEIFNAANTNGYFIEQDSEQYFSVSLDKFLADRLINGTCPRCGYEDARGDQCDSCGALLNPQELINPRCSIDGSIPELRSTRHLYLDLPKISEKLEAFQENIYVKGNWPNNAITTTRSWMKRGLEPRAITRDLKWGVPVPLKGFEGKVFYVWFDAPIGYISITRRAFPDTWEYWWKAPESTDLYQFMAKDNIPFHSVIFPASQLATGENWTMVHHLSSTEYLNYEDTKFSKSRNTGVFGTHVIDSGIDVDLWRFYLLAVRPERHDTAFSWQDFFDRVNNEFLDNIGNLVNRSLVYCSKNFDGKLVPIEYTDAQKAFIEEVTPMIAEVTAAFERVSLRDALKNILAVGKVGNRFFQDQEPWVRIKENRDEVQGTVNILAHLVKNIAIMLEPFMPETSKRIYKMLNIESPDWKQIESFDNLLGSTIGKPEILFRKLDVKLVDQYRAKYDGSEKSDPWDKIEIKVGKILDISRHPSAEHLYVEKIDLGEGEPRTIVSGLVKYFEAEELKDKMVMVASNLAPVELSGIESNGMVLCASKKKKMEIVSTDDMAIGSVVYREGEEPSENPEKISIDDFKQASLRAKNGLVVCDEVPLFADGKPLKTEVVLNSKIS